MTKRRYKCSVCHDGDLGAEADAFYDDVFACKGCGRLFGQGRHSSNQNDDTESDDVLSLVDIDTDDL